MKRKSTKYNLEEQGTKKSEQTWNVELTESEIKIILNSLAFTNCCDVNLAIDIDKKRMHTSNMKSLKLLEKLCKSTRQSIGDEVYLLKGFEYEDKKECSFLIKNLNITLKEYKEV